MIWEKSWKFPEHHPLWHCGLLRFLHIRLLSDGSGRNKKAELDFTVLEKEDIPEELKTEIEEKKDEPMKLTYTDQGQMYLVRGYGKKTQAGTALRSKRFTRRKMPYISARS